MAKLKISPELAEIIMAIIRGNLSPWSMSRPHKMARKALLFEDRHLSRDELVMSAIDQLIRGWGVEPIINDRGMIIAYFSNSLGLDEITIIWDNVNRLLLLKSVEQFLAERNIKCKNLCVN